MIHRCARARGVRQLQALCKYTTPASSRIGSTHASAFTVSWRCCSSNSSSSSSNKFAGRSGSNVVTPRTAAAPRRGSSPPYMLPRPPMPTHAQQQERWRRQKRNARKLNRDAPHAPLHLLIAKVPRKPAPWHKRPDAKQSKLQLLLGINLFLFGVVLPTGVSAVVAWKEQEAQQAWRKRRVLVAEDRAVEQLRLVTRDCSLLLHNALELTVACPPNTGC